MQRGNDEYGYDNAGTGRTHGGGVTGAIGRAADRVTHPTGHHKGEREEYGRNEGGVTGGYGGDRKDYDTTGTGVRNEGGLTGGYGGDRKDYDTTGTGVRNEGGLTGGYGDGRKDYGTTGTGVGTGHVPGTGHHHTTGDRADYGRTEGGYGGDRTIGEGRTGYGSGDRERGTYGNEGMTGSRANVGSGMGTQGTQGTDGGYHHESHKSHKDESNSFTEQYGPGGEPSMAQRAKHAANEGVDTVKDHVPGMRGHHTGETDRAADRY